MCSVLACSLVAVGCAGESFSGFRWVSLNILHGLSDEDPDAEPYDRFLERFSRVLAELDELAPDAILFQEVNLATEARYPDVRAEIARSLGSRYVPIFGDIFGSPAVRDARDAGIGQLTLTLREPTSFENHRVVAVESFRVRTVLRVRVEASEAIDLFNLHLQGPDDAAKAREELDDVLRFAEASDAATMVLAGDFNLADTSPVLSTLSERGFVDGAAASGLVCTTQDRRGCTNDTLPLAQPGSRADTRIDYAFVRSSMEVRCRPIFDRPFDLGNGGTLWASDHIGLSCELGVPD
ncbi:MAG: endonuclease/exonuclease/phosphatase family protein [Deltaproteobacteria bacterium]|nr:endonuclease/exonuclease/phosphatase family protein [Deltaproteobacteria bacterium]